MNKINKFSQIIKGLMLHFNRNISVNFDGLDHLLVRYSAFVSYWRGNWNVVLCAHYL